ncbi:hypothetical protein [Paracidovorax wautersii]|uniref:Uncharacterized protein n=1 Tax=Paracidovorax wautersii TaxID=1177982 RepID=A0A1I2GJG0_9BURK|nr:hypothetical protein [Paracidovorax wautersii]SFF17725.1 hypothetical protein SAMN04489711_11597 [Paracidovorax wautersii]
MYGGATSARLTGKGHSNDDEDHQCDRARIKASSVLDVHGMGMAAFLREMMAAVATRDAQTLAWIEQARL